MTKTEQQETVMPESPWRMWFPFVHAELRRVRRNDVEFIEDTYVIAFEGDGGPESEGGVAVSGNYRLSSREARLLIDRLSELLDKVEGGRTTR
jgi:hypothetical protein